MNIIKNGSIGVWFTDLELWALWKQAENRQGIKDKNRDMVQDKRSDTSINNIEMHYIGLKGEYAFQKVYGCGTDWTAYKSGDATGDFTYKGQRIEIKNLQKHLIFNDMDHFGADIAVLVNPFSESVSYRETAPDPYIKTKKAHCWRDVVLVGWTTREYFNEWSIPTDFGHGERLSLRAKKMSDMYDLFKIGE